MLQELLAKYPNLLAGDQMDASAPAAVAARYPARWA